MATWYFPAPMVLNLSHVTNCVTQATLVTQLTHVNAQVTSDICGVPRGGLLIFWPKAASYPDVSLRCARKGRREGDNGRDVASPAVCTLPMVPCGSSPVTRVSRSPLPCEKRRAWGGGCARSVWVGAIGWNAWSYNDWRLLKSGNQIRFEPFRTAVAHRIVT